MKKWFVRWRSLETVKQCYKDAGTNFGDAMSYLPIMGKCIEFDQLKADYRFWRAEWVRRGQKAVPLDNFIEYGGGYVAELKWHGNDV
jgi:hypothetical protein